MDSVKLPDGSAISYERFGSGPPLVLVHGSLSDHHTGWDMVEGPLGQRFTVYSMARRGRGETTAPQERRLEDEFEDLAALLQEIGGPAFVMGHSHGANVALGGAAARPDLVRKLALYEPPRPGTLPATVLDELGEAARREDWDAFVRTFLLATLFPPAVVDALQASPIWPPRVADAQASLFDFRSLARYEFDAGRFSSLTMPVLLLTGSESPQDIYLTDALDAALPDSRVVVLRGQGHVANAMAPDLFVDTVSQFLLG